MSPLLLDGLLANLITILALLTTAAFLFNRHKFRHWQRLGIPSPPARFPFGHFGDAFLQRQFIGDRVDQLYRATAGQRFAGLYSVYIPSLMLRCPQLIRTVLIKDFANFAGRGLHYDERSDPLSAHLFSVDGAKWRPMRNQLSPTFTSGKLRSMFATIVDCGAPLRRHMAAHGGQVLEMRELMAQFTSNVIASVAFGLDIDCIAQPDNAFRRFGRRVFEPTLRGTIVMFAGFLMPRLAKALRLKLTDPQVEEFFVSVVRQNLELREAPGAVGRKDFFQLLVQLRNGGVQADGDWSARGGGGNESGESQMSVEECAAQSFLFYVAGFETSSTTASFALYELARNPECQRRVRAEIEEVLARNGGEITYDAVAEMKYLECCIDETLRKYPPVAQLNRVCEREWAIPGAGGKTIPAGTAVMIPVYSLHMDEQYYAEPERFDPLRFSAERKAEKGFADRPYLPFGEGPRNCVGLRLGKIQTKVALIVMLRDCVFELAGNTLEPLRMDPAAFMLSPVGGIHLRATRVVK